MKKTPWTLDRFIYGLAFSWVNLGTAIIGFLTLGIYYPNWQMHLAKWYAFRQINQRKRSK